VRNGAGAQSVLALIDSHQPIERYAFRPYLAHLAAATTTWPATRCPASRASWWASTRACVPVHEPAARAGGAPRARASLPLPRRRAGGRLGWSAELRADEPPRFARGAEDVALACERTTLRYWDGHELRAGPARRARVPARAADLAEFAELGLAWPVTAPAPDQALAPGARVRFEGRAFLLEHNAFEFWIRIGLCRHVGAGPRGTDEVLRTGLFSIGQGGLFSAADREGGLEYALLARVPVPGPSVRAQRSWDAREPLDGHDPGTRWAGLQRFEDLPRLLDQGAFGDHPRVWVNCNASPHFVAARAPSTRRPSRSARGCSPPSPGRAGARTARASSWRTPRGAAT
jgi:hypothetical protein